MNARTYHVASPLLPIELVHYAAELEWATTTT